MTNSKSTKRALLLSALSILMCVAMLVGTTFAWFTDTASTAVNKIQAGTLDVVLEMADGFNDDGSTKWVDAEGKVLNFVKAEGGADQRILWEPGCTYELPALRIRNKGNLALKFKVVITGIAGDAELDEVIDWKINFPTAYGISDQWYKLNEGTGATLSNASGNDDFCNLIPGANTEFHIKGHMQESAGNEYQGKSINGIAITVFATQTPYEFDSTEKFYDEDAQFPDDTFVAAGVMQSSDGTYKISNAAGLKWFADQVNNNRNPFLNQTVELTSDIDLAGIDWKPIGNDGGAVFTGTFNGNGHTIKNLTVTDSRTSADEGTDAKYDGVGFFGWLNGYVNNVKFDNANVSGYHNVGVLAGYQQFGQIKDVTVVNSTVTGNHLGNAGDIDLCGDKIGGIVGVSYNVNYNDATATYVDMINCKIENTTVKGGRDTGKIAGAAVTFEGRFAGCTATGVTLGTTENCTGANIGRCLGGLVGRDID